MTSRIKTCREPRKVPADAALIYPSASGTGRFTPAQNLSECSDPVPTSEAELRAINCAQCGQHIEDYASIAACPLCESDNFKGKQL